MILLNGYEVKPTFFPDGTSQVWKLNPRMFKSYSSWGNEIEWRFEDEGEFMHLAQLKTLVEQVHPLWTLHLPYIPYARQDKEIHNEQTFALRVFAKLLNSLEFQHVTCCDPHSECAYNLINNVVEHYPRQQIEAAFVNTYSDIVCYPDEGARIKYLKALDACRFQHIYGEKERDQLTGHITHYKLEGDPKGKRVLIIDDICDGGMTFILLAKELIEKGAKEVNLFVSHGIFSKGIQILKDAGIKRIFTREGERK